MSQHDGNIAAGSGAAVRADINNALPALFTNSSGASAPGTTFECQFWADTNNNLLKMRNTADDAWITVGTLDEANLALAEKSYVDALIPRKDFHNLKIVNDGSTPNTKLVVTADWIFVYDGTNDKQLRSFSETLDASTTGANGMDTGSLAADTTYHLFAIAKEDGTDATLLSTSATSPTMPSGYTYKARISIWRTDGSGYLRQYRQTDNLFIPDAKIQISTGTAAQSWADQSLASYTGAVECVAGLIVTINDPDNATTFDVRTNGSSASEGPLHGAASVDILTNLFGIVITDSAGVVEFDINEASAGWFIYLNCWWHKL